MKTAPFFALQKGDSGVYQALFGECAQKVQKISVYIFEFALKDKTENVTVSVTGVCYDKPVNETRSRGRAAGLPYRDYTEGER